MPPSTAASRSSCVDRSTDFTQHPVEVLRFELAGEGVLLAGMVGVEERDAMRQYMRGTVCERILPEGQGYAGGPQVLEVRLMGKTAEGQYRFDPGQQLELVPHEPPTVLGFLRSRLISGGSASNRRGHVCVLERQPVIPMLSLRPVGEPRSPKRRKQKIAGTVAGEDPAGPVAPMSRRGKAQNVETGRRVSKTRNRLTPVLPISVGPPLDPGYFQAVRAKPRAPHADDDPPTETFQPRFLYALHET